LPLLLLIAAVPTGTEGKSSPLDKMYARDKMQKKAPKLIDLSKYLRDSTSGFAEVSSSGSSDTPPVDPHPYLGDFTHRLTSSPDSDNSANLYVYENKIPRIIHQMWKTTSVQTVFKEYIRTWPRMHPFWEYRFWTDASGEKFVKSMYPKFYQMFMKFNGIQKSDALRYFILHHFGGVYADLDVEAVAPLDSILNNTLTLSQEPLAHAVILEDRDRQVCNAFMASPPGHPFWPYVHEYMRDHQIRSDPVGSTGPRMLDAALDEYRENRTRKLNASAGNEIELKKVEEEWEDVIVAAPEVFMPLFDDKLQDFRKKCMFKDRLSKRQRAVCQFLKERDYENRIENETLTVHHWSHTWLGYVTSEDFVNVWEIVNTTRFKYLANTHFSSWIDSESDLKNITETNPANLLLDSDDN